MRDIVDVDVEILVQEIRNYIIVIYKKKVKMEKI